MNAIIAHAPGRVELLGNHTDYNEGLVLAAAIDRGVTVRGGALDGGVIELRSEAMGSGVRVNIDAIARQAEAPWADYPLGVVWSFLQEGLPVGGFRAEITSDLPMGAGLSSSAALEVATGKFLAKLFGLEIEPMRLAKLCQRAENEFVGMQCGLLDQASSVFGKKDHAVFLDCRSGKVETVPFPAGHGLLITQSGVKHAHAGGEYNKRRKECFEAARLLGVSALRDATPEQVQAARDKLPPAPWKRAAHVVGENLRVQWGVEALQRGDETTFGQLMFQSGESSRVAFENSTPEIDALVWIAAEIPGVLGARLTGGGFGGATVTLVALEDAERVAGAVAGAYFSRTGIRCEPLLFGIADGAG